MMYEKKQQKILKKQKSFEKFWEQLQVAHGALDSRRAKFNRNASILKRLLTWHFNVHLGKKGISGSIDVKYEEKTLIIQVTMPQDASRTSIQDTCGLSGGERSFSTLCFALALHQMTEAPFRAMDEFDVFMDAVTRKISLDTVVDFALEQGSKWIFITPPDIRFHIPPMIVPLQNRRHRIFTLDSRNFCFGCKLLVDLYYCSETCRFIAFNGLLSCKDNHIGFSHHSCVVLLDSILCHRFGFPIRMVNHL